MRYPLNKAPVTATSLTPCCKALPVPALTAVLEENDPLNLLHVTNFTSDEVFITF